MAAIVNDRDVKLQATVPRYAAVATKMLILVTDVPVFKFTGGTGAPTTSTLTAKTLGLVGTASWSVTGATLTGSGVNVRSLAASSIISNTVVVTATIVEGGVTYTSSVTIVKVTDGTNGSNGSNGSNGQRGSVTVVASGSSWSDSVASSAISSATGTSPINQDIVTITNGTSFTQTKFYNGGSWLTLTAYIDGNLLVSGTLSASQITAGTLTSSGISLGGGSFQVNGSTGAVSSTQFTGSAAVFGNLANPSTGAIVCSSSGSGPGISTSGSGSGNAINITGGANGIVQTGGGSNYLTTINPSSDGSYSLGTSGSFRWSALYANSATITTSDANSKTDIQTSDLGLDFVNSLRPVKYKQKVAENIVTFEPGYPTTEIATPRRILTPRAGTRYHYGLIAQEVRSAISAAGVGDAAFWALTDPTDPKSQQSLRYEELISPLIRAVQELSAQVAELKAAGLKT